jgi:hypothetical protein
LPLIDPPLISTVVSAHRELQALEKAAAPADLKIGQYESLEKLQVVTF